MMRLRTMMVLTIGLGAGYIAGTAAGRPAFERMRSAAGATAVHLGIADAGTRIRERGDGVARATVDLATTTTREVVDAAADKVEWHLAGAQSRLQGDVRPDGDPDV